MCEGVCECVRVCVGVCICASMSVLCKEVSEKLASTYTS